MPLPRLATPRLVLRAFVPDDLEALAAIYRDPEVRRYLPSGVLTREQTREELDWHLAGDPDHPDLGLWATCDRATGALVGRCGLLPWTFEGEDVVEVAYLLARDRWGRGLATEAATALVAHARDALSLRGVTSFVMHGNEASARVAEKAGMTRRPQDGEVDGHACQVFSMRF